MQTLEKYGLVVLTATIDRKGRPLNRREPDYQDCIDCGETKHITEFPLRNGEGSGHAKGCKPCVKVQSQIRAKLKKEFPVENLPVDYRCPVTGKNADELREEKYDSNPDIPMSKLFHLHHDHKTGEFIAYVSKMVNDGMGFLQDNPDYLEKSADLMRNPPGAKAYYDACGIGIGHNSKGLFNDE